jgi:anti-anti-sigma factor
MMQLETKGRGGLSIVKLRGSVQSRDNASFAAELDKLNQAGAERVLLDLGGLDYINSQAIADLLNFHDRLKARGGTMALAGLQPMVEKVVRAVGLGSLVAVHATAEEAMEALGGEN